MVDTARYLTRQLQQKTTNQDENVDAFNKKRNANGKTVNVRSALGDLGNKITAGSHANLMSKKDGMLALANKKNNLKSGQNIKDDDLMVLKALKEQTHEVIEINKPKSTNQAIKHEFILLPSILNQQSTTTITHLKQQVTTTSLLQHLNVKTSEQVKLNETSKMDISEQVEDIDIEEIDINKAGGNEEEEVDDDDDVDNEVDDEDERSIHDEHMKRTHVIDIDENDYENPQCLPDYVKDIYSYLTQLERKLRISNTFLQNKTVTSKMRAVLIDWLIQVHLKFHLLQETLYLCVQIIDAYLQAEDVSKMQLQLVGVTAMFLASKYEEMYVPTIEDFVYMTDNTYTKAEIRRMEIKILQTLNFMFGKPLPLNFLRRFSKAGQADPKQHTLSKFFMELSLHDSEFSSLDPSYLAACSLCLSYKLLDGPDWNDTLVYYTTYKYEELLPGIKKVAKLVLKSLESDYKYKAVINKYSSSKFLRISLIPELQGNIIKQFANLDL